jgi:hypothetical protein
MALGTAESRVRRASYLGVRIRRRPPQQPPPSSYSGKGEGGETKGLSMALNTSQVPLRFVGRQ